MNFAVVSASGIGDALITSIASHHLSSLGHKVTTFSRHLKGFGNWLEEGQYEPLDESKLSSFDGIVLQHDNTHIASRILELRKAGLPIYVFYTNYRFSKHGPLSPTDFAFNEGETMVANTRKAVETLFGGQASGRNCLYPPPHLIHRKEKRRILIHSTSSSPSKNWAQKRYELLAKRLKELGFTPFFLNPELPTLEDLASLMYESGAFIGNDSGPAHLASYLSIPHITLAPKIDFWRPGWYPGERITPPFYLRGYKWKYFITTEMVLSSFRSLIELNKNIL